MRERESHVHELPCDRHGHRHWHFRRTPCCSRTCIAVTTSTSELSHGSKRRALWKFFHGHRHHRIHQSTPKMTQDLTTAALRTVVRASHCPGVQSNADPVKFTRHQHSPHEYKCLHSRSPTTPAPRADNFSQRADDLSAIVWKLAVSHDCNCSCLQGTARWSRRCLSPPPLRRHQDLIT